MWVRSYGRKSRALGDPEEIDIAAIVGHQLAANDRALAALGLSVKEEERIAEIGSGESISERPRFAAILQELQSRPPGDGLFVVTELARISRASMGQFGQIMDTFTAAGVKVLAGGRRFDLENPDDELQFTFFAGLARHEVRNYARRTAVKKDQLTREGEITNGSAPFGYVWVKGRGRQRGNLEPIPEQIEIVRALFREALSLSIPRLSEKYGLPPNTVNYILRNPVYTGYPHRHTIANGRFGTHRGSRLLPEHQWPLRAEQQGRYEPAITLEQYYAARDALARRWVERAKTGESDGWCRRLLVLEDWPDARVILDSQEPGAQPCYAFIDRATGRKRNYLRAPIHDAAAAKILAALANPSGILRGIEEERERRLNAENSGERDRLRGQLAVLRSKLADLYEERAGSDPEDRLALETAQERIKTQIRTIQQSLGPIGPGQHPPPFVLSQELLTRGPYFEPGSTLAFEEVSPAEKALLAQDLLARIVVRIVPRGRPRPSERQIVRIDYVDWFQPFAQP